MKFHAFEGTCSDINGRPEVSVFKSRIALTNGEDARQVVSECMHAFLMDWRVNTLRRQTADIGRSNAVNSEGIRLQSRLKWLEDSYTAPSFVKALYMNTKDDGLNICATEFVRGIQLTKFVADNIRSDKQLVDLLQALLLVLYDLDSAGVVHRDLTPNNFIVQSRQQLNTSSPTSTPDNSSDPYGPSASSFSVWLVDFSQAVSPLLPSSNLLPPGSYRHPNVSLASDVYSMGLVVLELLRSYLNFDAAWVLPLVHRMTQLRYEAVDSRTGQYLSRETGARTFVSSCESEVRRDKTTNSSTIDVGFAEDVTETVRWDQREILGLVELLHSLWRKESAVRVRNTAATASRRSESYDHDQLQQQQQQCATGVSPDNLTSHVSHISTTSVSDFQPNSASKSPTTSSSSNTENNRSRTGGGKVHPCSESSGYSSLFTLDLSVNRTAEHATDPNGDSGDASNHRLDLRDEWRCASINGVHSYAVRYQPRRQQLTFELRSQALWKAHSYTVPVLEQSMVGLTVLDVGAGFSLYFALRAVQFGARRVTVLNVDSDPVLSAHARALVQHLGAPFSELIEVVDASLEEFTYSRHTPHTLRTAASAGADGHPPVEPVPIAAAAEEWALKHHQSAADVTFAFGVLPFYFACGGGNNGGGRSSRGSDSERTVGNESSSGRGRAPAAMPLFHDNHQQDYQQDHQQGQGVNAKMDPGAGALLDTPAPQQQQAWGVPFSATGNLERILARLRSLTGQVLLLDWFLPQHKILRSTEYLARAIPPGAYSTRKVDVRHLSNLVGPPPVHTHSQQQQEEEEEEQGTAEQLDMLDSPYTDEMFFQVNYASM